MNKIVLTAMICATLAARASAVDNSKLDSLKTWFKHLRQGLMESSVESYNQKHRGVTAVAAVRGAKQSAVDPERPEWKTAGKSKRLELKKERQDLSAAVEKIVSGDTASGRAGLDAFEKDHPRSKFLPEVAKARAKLQELDAILAAITQEAAAPPAAPAPAPAE